MPQARRTAAAEDDLRQIAYHIGMTSRQPAMADRVIDERISQCETIAKFSPDTTLGTLTPEIGEGVRLFHYKRWIIMFRYMPHGIDVLRFADGSQDYLTWQLF